MVSRLRHPVERLQQPEPDYTVRLGGIVVVQTSEEIVAPMDIIAVLLHVRQAPVEAAVLANKRRTAWLAVGKSSAGYG
jgi:hypothetical protein